MFKSKEECIARKAFGSLILDYEWEEDKLFNLPPCVSCRVLIDGTYKTTIHAETREEAINIFMSGEWKKRA